jgi:4-amino-4-deoxy-L-arabinose transferase-like glycosyltransferase
MKRVNLVIAMGLFIGSFILYIRTLAPSLLYGDSAEFQTIAYTLGVGHPTGYPVYVLLAKLFTLIPVGEIAYRVNLFSAFCAALTIGLVYLILRKLGVQIIPSICGALALALTSLFWKYASMAEIYAPAAACLAFVFYAIFQWKETNHSRWMLVAGLIGGLSLGIHATVALSGIPVLLYLLLSRPNRATWIQALFGTTIGLGLFLLSFLFLDALNSPAGY